MAATDTDAVGSLYTGPKAYFRPLREAPMRQAGTIDPKSCSYPDPASAVTGIGVAIVGAKRWQI